MSNNESVQAVFEQAEELLRLCRGLNYQAIVAHDPNAVTALQEAVRLLRNSVRRGDGESLANYAGAQVQRRPQGEPAPLAGGKDAQMERRRRFVEALGAAGMGERLGKLYCTSAERRQVAFRDAPHKTGLPQFDMVVGPDYSPINGYHGIFISGQEVMSWVLPEPGDSHQWQLRERERFGDIEQLVDMVGLLSAGFPLK